MSSFLNSLSIKIPPELWPPTPSISKESKSVTANKNLDYRLSLIDQMNSEEQKKMITKFLLRKRSSVAPKLYSKLDPLLSLDKVTEQDIPQPFQSRDVSYLRDPLFKEGKYTERRQSCDNSNPSIQLPNKLKELKAYARNLSQSDNETTDELKKISIKTEIFNNLGEDTLLKTKEIFATPNKKCYKQNSVSGLFNKGLPICLEKKQGLGVPSSRHDAVTLSSWMDLFLEKIINKSIPVQEKMQLMQQIYYICLREAVRQISVHCVERGDLVWRIFSAYIMIINNLQTVYDEKQKSNEAEYNRKFNVLQKFLEHQEDTGKAEIGKLKTENEKKNAEIAMSKIEIGELQDKLAILNEQLNSQYKKTKAKLPLRCNTNMNSPILPFHGIQSVQRKGESDVGIPQMATPSQQQESYISITNDMKNATTDMEGFDEMSLSGFDSQEESIIEESQEDEDSQKDNAKVEGNAKANEEIKTKKGEESETKKPSQKHVSILKRASSKLIKSPGRKKSRTTHQPQPKVFLFSESIQTSFDELQQNSPMKKESLIMQEDVNTGHNSSIANQMPATKLALASLNNISGYNSYTSLPLFSYHPSQYKSCTPTKSPKTPLLNTPSRNGFEGNVSVKSNISTFHDLVSNHETSQLEKVDNKGTSSPTKRNKLPPKAEKISIIEPTSDTPKASDNKLANSKIILDKQYTHLTNAVDNNISLSPTEKTPSIPKISVISTDALATPKMKEMLTTTNLSKAIANSIDFVPKDIKEFIERMILEAMRRIEELKARSTVDIILVDDFMACFRKDMQILLSLITERMQNYHKLDKSIIDLVNGSKYCDKGSSFDATDNEIVLNKVNLSSDRQARRSSYEYPFKEFNFSHPKKRKTMYQAYSMSRLRNNVRAALMITKNILSLRALLKIITTTYKQMLSLRTDETNDMTSFLMRAYVTKYGLVPVAEKHIICIMSSCVHYREVPRVSIFARFLKLFDNLFAEDIKFYLDIQEYILKLHPSFFKDNSESAERQYTPIVIGIECTRSYFEAKLSEEQYSSLKDEVLKASSNFLIDVDLLAQVLLRRKNELPETEVKSNTNGEH